MNGTSLEVIALLIGIAGVVVAFVIVAVKVLRALGIIRPHWTAEDILKHEG